jgi:hypothetical protein
MTNSAFGLDFILNGPLPKAVLDGVSYARTSSAVRDRRTAGDRNFNAAITRKTELDTALYPWPQASPSPTLLDGGAAMIVIG